MDISDSIVEDQFNKARNAVKKLIIKVCHKSLTKYVMKLIEMSDNMESVIGLPQYSSHILWQIIKHYPVVFTFHRLAPFQSAQIMKSFSSLLTY